MDTDRIFEAFLARQGEEAAALAAAGDLLEVVPLGGTPPRRWIARFRCRGLVRVPGGEVVEADDFAVGIWLPDDYLRRMNPFEVVTWLGPRHVFHPNISPHHPFICLGHLAPGMSLVDILYQCFEIITYQKATLREDDALNVDACAWARRNLDRLPVDPRPLKRRTLDLAVEPLGGERPA
jgi:hypothetical protein